MSAAIASLTHGALAKVDSREVTLTVSGLPPAAAASNGESFLPDLINVRTRHSEGPYGTFTYATLTGPYTGFRGGHGTAFFMLAGQCAITAATAPPWLSALLTNAGVTW